MTCLLAAVDGQLPNSEATEKLRNCFAKNNKINVVAESFHDVITTHNPWKYSESKLQCTFQFVKKWHMGCIYFMLSCKMKGMGLCSVPPMTRVHYTTLKPPGGDSVEADQCQKSSNYPVFHKKGKIEEVSEMKLQDRTRIHQTSENHMYIIWLVKVHTVTVPFLSLFYYSTCTAIICNA